MSKVIRFLLFFLFISVFWLNLSAKPVLAVDCNFSFNPSISDLNGNYTGGLQVTITSGNLIDGKYNVHLYVPDQRNPFDSNGKDFTQATGLTVSFGERAIWKPGSYKVVLSSTSNEEVKGCNKPFDISDTPLQACTLSIGNSKNPVPIGENIVVNVSGQLQNSRNTPVSGGYTLYADGKPYAISYLGEGKINIGADKFGTSPVGLEHTIAIRHGCHISEAGCFEFLQCPILKFGIAENKDPTCKASKTGYPSNELIEVLGENLPKGNHNYFTDIYKLPPSGIGVGTIVPIARDSEKTDSSGRIVIQLSNALNVLGEGNYTADIVDVTTDGTVTSVCPKQAAFHVTLSTPIPHGAIICSVTNKDTVNETDDVLFKAEFGDGVDINTFYTPVIDGATEKPASKPDASTRTINTSLGKFSKDQSHTVDLKGKLCTNDETERTFQTKAAPAAAGAAPPDPHCTEKEKKAGKCTKGGGESCDGGKGIKTAIGCIHTNPAVFAKDFLTFAIGIGGGLAFLMMLLGAFQMLTSAGNPDSLKAGQDRLTSAVIGLLFVIFTVLLLQIIGADILKIPDFKP